MIRAYVMTIIEHLRVIGSIIELGFRYGFVGNFQYYWRLIFSHHFNRRRGKCLRATMRISVMRTDCYFSSIMRILMLMLISHLFAARAQQKNIDINSRRGILVGYLMPRKSILEAQHSRCHALIFLLFHLHLLKSSRLARAISFPITHRAPKKCLTRAELSASIKPRFSLRILLRLRERRSRFEKTGWYFERLRHASYL